MANLRAKARQEVRPIPNALKYSLIAVAVAYCGVLLILPLLTIFVEALRQGWLAYFKTFRDPAAISAIQMTLLAAVIAVPLNVVFGIAASWAIAKFEFRGKSILLSLIDMPFGISPIISGMLFVILFGARFLR